MAEALVSSEQVAAALHVGPAAIRKYARAGRIPFVTTPGGHRRYDLEAVRAALTGTGDETTFGGGDYDDVGDPGPKAVLGVETEFLGIQRVERPTLHPAEWATWIAEDGLA